MNDLPLVPRERAAYPTTAFVPMDYVRPGWSLAQLLSILRAYRTMTLSIVAAVMLLTVAAVTFWPRTYTATASVMVNYEVNDPINGKELPLGQVASYIATQVELMQTPELLLAVVDRLNLTEDVEYARGWRNQSGTLRDWAASQVARTLAVFSSQRGGQLIYVTFSADDPQRAAEVANAVVDLYKAQETQRAAGPPTERAARYTAQIEALKAKVDQAQQQVTAFHRRNGLIEGGGRTNIDVLQMAALNERLLAAQNARRVTEAHAAEDTEVSDGVLASTEVQALKAQLGTQEQRLAQLERQYTPLHPDVRDMRAQVEASRRAIALTVNNYGSNALANRTVAARLERGLQRAVDEQQSRMFNRTLLEDEAAKTRLELESAHVVYRRALESYDPMMFASRGHFANVSQVSQATPPVRASKPRVLLGLAIGAVMALLLGLGLPVAWEQFNRRVRCRDDIERDHGLPVLVEFGRLPLATA